MGHSRDEKADSHERIVATAAARIRESGTATPGVTEVMNAAGLTHGGFYKHFDSREDLIAEAVERTFAESEQEVSAVTADAADPLAAFVDWYVSAGHRDNPATGCGVVALGADVARADTRVRDAYTAQVKRYLTHLEELAGDRATVMLSTLVGAVLVARAVDDAELSDQILRDVREALKSG
jgi:TetR/AcrR family transcriptional regulator, transcriptional repressor for nem operon